MYLYLQTIPELFYAHITAGSKWITDWITASVKFPLCFIGKWFEVSPHEAGFTELGIFVETSLLGSKFQSGELQEQKPEMDMIELQGVCLNVRMVTANTKIAVLREILFTLTRKRLQQIWLTVTQSLLNRWFSK